MAVTKITWENKTGIQNDASVTRKNKVVDEDMNEIKQVVNNNADEVTSMQETIKDLQEGTDTSDTDITSLKNRVSTLETDNSTNKTDINNLKTDNETNKSNIQTLQQDNETNKKDIVNLEENKVDKVEGKGLSTEDFTTELKEKLEGLKNYDDTEVKADISDLQKKIETNKKDISDIKAEQTQQNTELSNLKNDILSNSIEEETEQSKSLYIEDASGARGSLSVEGNQEQDGEPSPTNPINIKCLGSNKQLFNKDTCVLDNRISTGGELYKDSSCAASDYIEVKPNTTYTFNYEAKDIHRTGFYDANKNFIKGNITDSIFTTPENCYYLRLSMDKDFIDKVKLEEGTKTTTYSKYGEGSTLISKINKNFLNIKITDTTINGVNFKINNDKSITVNGTATADIIANLTTGQFSDGTTSTENIKIPDSVTSLKLSGCPSGGSSSSYKIDLWSAKNTLILTDFGDGILKASISDNDRSINRARIIIYQGATLNNLTFKPMLVSDTEDKEYELHQEKNYNLPIQQEMLIRDYFVKENGIWKEVHNFDKYIFNGTENYIKSPLSDSNYLRAYTRGSLISSSKIVTDGKIFATRYKDTGIYSSSTTGNRIACRGQFHVQISVEFLAENTAEAYNTLLKQWYDEGNPLVAYYQLQTPTKLACTPEQSAVLEELINLEMYKGVNNIFTTEDIALLKAKYGVDLKTYIDGKLANINAQILNIAGGK